MVTGKRALIVDDSRSARVILSRMLEQHGMGVDTAESAEQALEFLAQNRPDVIFMDHLMPGMDGFQAVQAIKSDPQTATIPLMMYTSQEGELYVSQARALGAVGVLPKTVRPVDVSRVLYQLHLLPDRRQNRTALFERGEAEAAVTGVAEELATGAHAAVAAAGANVAAAGGGGGGGTGSWNPPLLALSELQGGLRQSVQQLLKDQLAEQRRFMLATFEAFARRMGNDVKEHVAKIPAPVAVEPIPPEPPRRDWWPVALTGIFAALPALVLGTVFMRANETDRALVERLDSLEKQQARLESATRAVASTAPGALQGPVQPAGPLAVEYVPYGETPLAGARLERLRTLAGALEAQGFRGRIVAESFVGDFCLDGTSAGEGFTVAPPATLLQKCVLMGNPFDDGLSNAQRQSVAFANFAATLKQRTGGAIEVAVENGGRTSPIEYPEQREDTTAGEWNRIAALNNRVEFRADAATSLAQQSAPTAAR
jgi:CheY-like chemotaxis protein